MKKCCKCKGTNFIKSERSTVSPFLTYHLCECGNVMLSDSRFNHTFVPSPEAGRVAEVMMEDAAKALGLPADLFFKTQEEIEEKKEELAEMFANLMSQYEDEEEYEDEYEDEEEYDEEYEDEKEDEEDEILAKLTAIGIAPDMNIPKDITPEQIDKLLSFIFDDEDEEEIEEDEEEIEENKECCSCKTDSNYDDKEERKSYVVLERGAGWKLYRDVTKAEISEKINNDEELDQFLIFEVKPVKMEQEVKFTVM